MRRVIEISRHQAVAGLVAGSLFSGGCSESEIAEPDPDQSQGRRGVAEETEPAESARREQMVILQPIVTRLRPETPCKDHWQLPKRRRKVARVLSTAEARPEPIEIESPVVAPVLVMHPDSTVSLSRPTANTTVLVDDYAAFGANGR